LSNQGLYGDIEDGPWTSEPDEVQFEASGYPCLLLRGPMHHWCGYVAVPPGHPAHGRHFNDLDELLVHGGVTYSEAAHPLISHPGAPEGAWYIGFDCGHAGDLEPGGLGIERELAAAGRAARAAVLIVVGPQEAYVERDYPPLPDLSGVPPEHAQAFLDQMTKLRSTLLRDTYRDMAYARAETERLAAQLRAMPADCAPRELDAVPPIEERQEAGDGISPLTGEPLTDMNMIYLRNRREVIEWLKSKGSRVTDILRSLVEAERRGRA
jgi:hypothetical protein